MWLLSISAQRWSLARQRESVPWAHFLMSLAGLQNCGPNGYRRFLPEALQSQRRFHGFRTFRPRSDRRRFRLSWFRLSSAHAVSERLPACRHLDKRAAVPLIGHVLGPLQALSGVALIFRDSVHAVKSTRRNGECSEALGAGGPGGAASPARHSLCWTFAPQRSWTWAIHMPIAGRRRRCCQFMPSCRHFEKQSLICRVASPLG